ncbi:syndetin [Hetaerina americana]|uniref:syndetin n=1 Tax=Hetaerina americana TaxID=62018 RepID=UPI003A7F3282
MEDLKHKILLLINKQNPHQRFDEGEKPPDWMYRRKLSRPEDESQKVALEDLEILDSIDEGYFVEENEFDSCRFELKKLPAKLECEKIQQERLKLCQQQKVVSKKVLQLILQKQLACSDEFKRVLLVQDDVGVALRKAADGRRWLGLARHNLTSASLGILANYKKRLALTSLLTALHAIKTLHQSEEKVQELLHGGAADGGMRGDYVGAIRLLLECQGAAATFGHFSCVDALSAKLQDTLEMAEEQLDVALAKVCVDFGEAEYSRVQEAWRLVGKTQAAVDQMQMHISTALHATAASALSAHLSKGAVAPPSEDVNKAPAMETGEGVHQVDMHHMQYKELCKNVPHNEFLPCLSDLCKSLWGIVRSYHQVVNWHCGRTKTSTSEEGSRERVDVHGGLRDGERALDRRRREEGGGSVEQGEDEDSSGDLFGNDYVMQKLNTGLTRIWNEVQSKICVFLLASDLSWYKFDDFLRVLDIIHRLIEVGEEFCGSRSPELQDSVRAKSLEYVSHHHRATLDELRIFLENEGWEICPVRPSFSILQLREYRCLRSHFHSQSSLGTSDVGGAETSFNSPVAKHGMEEDGYFSKYASASNGTPFDEDSFADEAQDEDILLDKGESSVYWSDESEEDEDIPEDMKRDLVDENAGEVNMSGKGLGCAKKRPNRGPSFRGKPPLPFLTNTALTVLRLVGRYIRMACLLRPIAPGVIVRATHLYEYYLYTVFHFFASEVPLSTERVYSYKLETLLERIHDKLILSDDKECEVPSQDSDKVLHAHLSPVVELSKPENLYGLAERIAAAESVSFLSSQFLLLQPYLESLLLPPPTLASRATPHRGGQSCYQHGTPSHTARHFLTQFYSQTVNVADELRRPIYLCVSKGAVNLRQILGLMAQVNWEVPDVMSQHSPYIDILLRELQIFAMRLEGVASRVPLPSSVHLILWQQVVGLVCDTFVEGFASAGRHCSNGGRGLMQLDFTQFLTKVESILGGEGVGGGTKERVEAYVKAFYQPEAGLELWIKEHGSQYSQKQLVSLVSCVCQNSKKSRQRLLGLIEDIDRGGR